MHEVPKSKRYTGELRPRESGTETFEESLKGGVSRQGERSDRTITEGR